MKLLKLAALVAATAFLGVAQAELCTATTSTPGAPVYEACQGSFSGNINQNPGDGHNELTELSTLFTGTWAYGGDATSSALGTGPFTVSFAAQTGVFVIGLKAANNYSFYEFDAGGVAISSISFDTTAGIATNRRGIPQALSHAELYVGPSAVPEPETYALMIAGLTALGFYKRRRAG